MPEICHVTSAHPRYDIRIFVKECQSLVQNNYNVNLIVADNLADENYKLDASNSIAIFDVGKELGRFNRMWKTPKKIYHKVLELRPDIIHFHDPELMLIALKLQKKGFKVIYDVHEDLPKQIQNKHWLPVYSRNIMARIAIILETFVAKRISGIVAATPIIATRFCKYNSNTVTVCNYPLLREMDISSVTTDFGLRRNAICYIGSISKPRGILPLLASLELSKINLELAGNISSDLSYEELKQIPGFNYSNYRGIIDRNAIIKLLGEVKVGMVTLLPTPSYIESLPIKMFEYMLAGIPVVASNFSLWRDIVEKYKCGILVDPTNPDEIAKVCTHLVANDKLAEVMGKNGKNAVIEHFNWKKEEIKLINFYKVIFYEKS